MYDDWDRVRWVGFAHLDEAVGGMIQHDSQQVSAGLCCWSSLEVSADQTNPTQLAQELLAQLQPRSRPACIACAHQRCVKCIT